MSELLVIATTYILIFNNCSPNCRFNPFSLFIRLLMHHFVAINYLIDFFSKLNFSQILWIFKYIQTFKYIHFDAINWFAERMVQLSLHRVVGKILSFFFCMLIQKFINFLNLPLYYWLLPLLLILLLLFLYFIFCLLHI